MLNPTGTPQVAQGETVRFTARGIHKSFPGVHALRGVDLTCRAGAVHALVGENGAGKSTLMSVITGVRQPDAGELRWEGESLRLRGPKDALERGIAAVYQELTVLPYLSVADNVLLGQELTRHGALDRRATRRRVTELLDRLGLGDVRPEARAGNLSVAQRQLVEIARALARDARLLLLDEPTAVLADREIEQLFTVIRDLARSGVAIVYISHRLQELASVADEITVLRDGANISHESAATYETAHLVRDMVGREVGPLLLDSHEPGQAVVLSVRNLQLPGTEPEGVSLDVRAGEVVGLAGLVGSGRSRFLRTLVGLAPSHGGQVRILDRTIRRLAIRSAARAGMVYLPEERKSHGLVLDLTLAANITLPVLRLVSRAGVLSPAKERATAGAAVQQLGIRASGLRQRVRDLSGGNQQKTVLAKWLQTRPQVLLLDEPTRGVDVGGKSEIHRLIRDLASEGLATVVVSSELPELLGLCHRVLVFRRGEVVGELRREHATEEAVVGLAMGTREGGSTKGEDPKP